MAARLAGYNESLYYSKGMEHYVVVRGDWSLIYKITLQIHYSAYNNDLFHFMSMLNIFLILLLIFR